MDGFIVFSEYHSSLAHVQMFIIAWKKIILKSLAECFSSKKIWLRSWQCHLTHLDINCCVEYRYKHRLKLRVVMCRIWLWLWLVLHVIHIYRFSECVWFSSEHFKIGFSFHSQSWFLMRKNILILMTSYYYWQDTFQRLMKFPFVCIEAQAETKMINNWNKNFNTLPLRH